MFKVKGEWNYQWLNEAKRREANMDDGSTNIADKNCRSYVDQ